jgi:hypothetical protein
MNPEGTMRWLSIGQRNEFVAIVGGQVELPASPVALAPLLLGGLDLLLAGRHEIPLDVARAAERRAAEDDKTGTGGAGGDANRVLRPEDHHLTGLKRLARHRDRSF